MSRIKIGYIAGAILLIYAALFVILPHTEYLPSDGGLKILQIKDLIKQEYRSFSAVYNAATIDPDFNYFPIGAPSAYRLGDQMYYTFPFYIPLLYAPVFSLLGVKGFVFVCMVFGLLTVFVSMRIALLLGMGEENRKWLLLFLGIASIIPVYSFLIGEYTLSIFLATLAIYLVLLGKEKGNAALYFLAGLSAGGTVFFRIEAGLFCVLLVISTVVFRMYTRPVRDVGALFSALSLCAIILIGCNYHVTGNIFGLRGIEFLANSGVSYTVLERFEKLFKAFFFNREGIGLFIAWPIFIFLYGFLIRDYRVGENLEREKFLLLIITVFFISIPVIISNSDGSILGPRFLAILQPALAVVTFRVLDFQKMKTRVKLILARGCVVFSVLITIGACVILYMFDQISDDVNTSIAAEVKSKVVVLYPGINYHTVLPLFKDRMIVRIDPIKDWERLRMETKKLGINEYSVLDYAEGRSELPHPGIEKKITVNNRYMYRGKYKKVLVETIAFID